MGADTRRPVGAKPSDSRKLIDMFTLAAFETVALMTGHDHWRKTPEQVAPLTEPLTMCYNTLTATTRKRIAKYAAPGLAVVGAVVVIAPDISREIRLRRPSARRPIEPPGHPGENSSRPADIILLPPTVAGVDG